jgi:chorismate mutase
MMSADRSLDALRREIDAIDESLHDLIMRRTTVVEQVRDLKRGHKVKIRPAREAEILYRLASRHQGPFPPSTCPRRPARIGTWRATSMGPSPP